MSQIFSAPLAERMRPETLDEVVGQDHIVGDRGILTSLIQNLDPSKTSIPSLIFWGPPGCGKTTIARIVAKTVGLPYLVLSAINTSTADSKKIISEAGDRFKNYRKPTILFIDEIHRFNKNQQDVYLHSLELGEIILFGATTENPSFELNPAILSRTRVVALKTPETNEIIAVLHRALANKELGLGMLKKEFSDDAIAWIAETSGGDVRSALSMLETIASTLKEDECNVDLELAKKRALRSAVKHDKTGESHYNLISALHKSIRNSDPDAALLWLSKLIAGGEDPKFIARRLVRMAYEDIGLADPHAAPQANACFDAVQNLGYPECDVVLAQATVYLACAPKSNAVYNAIHESMAVVHNNPAIAVPLKLRNASTKLMKQEGYGKDYAYDHEYPHHVGPAQSWPENLKPREFYRPGDLGFEKELQKRLLFFKTLRTKE